jgi:hypothetical protein
VEEGDAPTEDKRSGYIFPHTAPQPRCDWSQYRGADTNYVEPLPWVPAFPPEHYMQASIKDLPEDDDTDGLRAYVGGALADTVDEAVERAMAISGAEERVQ